MLSILPGNFHNVINADFGAVRTSPVALIFWLINLMFVVDVAMASVGYLLTMKPLDAHIRSATPYAAGWTAALICYPPFVLMGGGAPLDYSQHTAEWNVWIGGNSALIIIYGTILVMLTAIYAWATMVFGLRFSNLTDRGILTHGPYAWTKHPAYLAKNSFWWLSSLPFLTVNGSLVDAIRNTVLLAMVSGVYYWRARTEEKHLSVNVEYRDYAAWMKLYGPITRHLQWPRRHIGGRQAVPAE
jgi:protein-S-isoprenylcysteine O-methyltransferase Ste14